VHACARVGVQSCAPPQRL